VVSRGTTGKISGTATAAAGGGALAGVSVTIYHRNGNYVVSATTGSDGSYTVTGLAPSTIGYTVCFDASSATGGSSPAGYADQCYNQVAWNGNLPLPSGTTPVPVTAGAISGGINAALIADGGISGTVTAATGGGELANVSVYVYDQNGNLLNYGTTTGSDGSYTATGLAPSATGYTVCFDAPSATGGSSSAGYADQCYNQVAWNGGLPLPSGTTPVSVTAGVISGGINIALISDGGISGTVTAATGGGELANVSVYVYDQNGDELNLGATTGPQGTYTITRLAPSATGYILCFDASSATGGSSHLGYADQCYKHVVWSGGFPPSGTTLVPVTGGAISAGIDAALISEGAISGRVTAATGGGPLTNVIVYVFARNGKNEVSAASTGSHGGYTVKGLAPSATGYILCFDASSASPAGYADQCYNQVSWNGFSPLPSGTTLVPVKAGATSTGIDAALTGQGISGTVTASAGGGALAGVIVYVYDRYGDHMGSATTGSDGSYTVTGLAPSATGYTVCFDASSATGGSSLAGYADQCYNQVPWNGFPPIPANATRVPVTAGGTTTGVDVALTSEGGISGTVTAATDGDPLANVIVYVYDQNGNQLNDGVSTGSDGSYTVTGLAPSATGYIVCFDARSATGGGSSAGYADQCYNQVAWNPNLLLPSGATAVPVTAGVISTGIDAALPTDEGISGTVTAAAGGSALANVTILVFDQYDNLVSSNVTTGSDGSYTVTGLVTSAPGYRVCFDASSATGGSSPAGYADQCYDQVAWNGNGFPPLGATLVAVNAGVITTGIDAALTSEGGISGTVTAAAGGGALTGVEVEVYDRNGNPVESLATTGSDGRYTLTGLAPSTTGYTVCFFTGLASGGSSSFGYENQCYNQVPWSTGSSLPSGTTAVPVQAGAISTGIDAALTSDGAISGAVTAATGGAALAGVTVYVFDPNGNYVTTSTGSDGSYIVTGLVPSATGYTVCFDTSYATGGSSAYGYADQCYNQVAWPGLSFPRPSGAKLVPVTAEANSTGVDAALISEGAISGTVTSATSGSALARVRVTVYDQYGNQLNYITTTNSNGSYTVIGLVPSATGYTVCFATAATGGSSSAGYADQCYNQVPWSGDFPTPSGTTPVPVQAGANSTGIDAALTSEGGISGTVTAATGGSGLRAVDVRVFDPTGQDVAEVKTSAAGSYTVTGLPPSSVGYIVCFDATNASGGSSPVGYQSQCYQNVSWEGGYVPAAGAADVVVSQGTITTAVNAALVNAGGIAGSVTAADGGAALTDVGVAVYTKQGNFLTSKLVNSHGTYVIKGLAPGGPGYIVCFSAGFDTGGSSLTGYASQCFRRIPWSSGAAPPAAATVLQVRTGQVTAHVNAALLVSGGISGTVTAAGGTPLKGVAVRIFDDVGNYLQTVTTASDGTYGVQGLAATTTGYIVCFDPAAASPAGYAGQCNAQVPWAGGFVPPPGVTPVPVSTLPSKVNAALQSAGSISGRVTAPNGAALPRVTVDVYDASGNRLAKATTTSDGSYVISGLPPATSGYRVCFNPTGIPTGIAGHSYAGQCYSHVPWNPEESPPSAAPLISLPPAFGLQGINAKIAFAGSISGTVTSASGGAALGRVTVDVYNDGGALVASVTTKSSGAYQVTRLAAESAGYVICFAPAGAVGGPSPAGYYGQCYQGVTWVPWSVPPAGATVVHVSAGKSANSINGALAAAGGISGTVSTASGGLSGVAVDLYDDNGDLLTTAITASNGAYTLRGLAASTTGYTVCFDASHVGGSASAGYQSQCYQGIAWVAGSSPSAGVALVPVSDGAITMSIDATLNSGAGLTGRVAAAGGGALAGVQVQAFDSNGNELAASETTAAGSYILRGLAPSSIGYTICFDATSATEGQSSTGYISQCYDNIVWDPGGPPPAGVTPVPVPTAGALSKLNVTLPASGAISGTVTTAGGTTIGGVTVDAFDSTGELVSSATSATDGSYLITNLPISASGYSVCFDATTADTASSGLAYASQCSSGVAWVSGTPPPAGITPVVVTSTHPATEINANLVISGSVSGTVTTAGGLPVQAVAVTLFDIVGQALDFTQTGADGSYQFTGLPPATSGYEVCFDATSTTGADGASYGSTCYGGSSWNPTGPPSGATPVSVAPGAGTTGISVTLTNAGAISGAVTDAVTGQAVPFVSVAVLDSNGNLVASAFTAQDGTYTVASLQSSASGYTVCFDASFAISEGPSGGYTSQCFNNVAWNSGSPAPSGTTPVPVSNGQTTTGINAALKY
jgi:hypothetical protein